MQYGLKESTIEKLCSVFSKHSQVNQVILYGSRAKGNYRKASDIDLTLIGEDLALSELFHIETEIDDLLLPYKVDLSIYSHIDNPELIQHIKRVGKVLYEKKS